MVSVATIHFCYCSSNAPEIIHKQVWLGSPTTTTNLLTKTGSEPYLACRPCCRSRQALWILPWVRKVGTREFKAEQ